LTEIEWERRMGREQAAKLLRRVADGLASGDKVKLEHDGFELKVAVADQVEVEIEVELHDGDTEVELELKWKTGGSGDPGGEDTATTGVLSPGDVANAERVAEEGAKGSAGPGS
jgi:amphi-Trp domain-containing protein